jgi:hypothetical protein
MEIILRADYNIKTRVSSAPGSRFVVIMLSLYMWVLHDFYTTALFSLGKGSVQFLEMLK